jgi:hypothetical protein
LQVSINQILTIAELVEQHNQEKARMIEEEKKQHFSYDVLITLTEEEKKANEKLKNLKDIWATPLYNVVL